MKVVFLRIKKDDGLDDDCDNNNTLPSHLGAFILSNSKRIMNNFILHESCIIRLKKDDGIDDDCDFNNTLPSHLGAFILSISKRIMNSFSREKHCFYNNSIYYGDTDSLYIGKKILGYFRQSKLSWRRVMKMLKMIAKQEASSMDYSLLVKQNNT